MNSIKENKIYCGFCLKTPEILKKENQILHAGLDAFICEGCVETLIHIKSNPAHEKLVMDKILLISDDPENYLLIEKK